MQILRTDTGLAIGRFGPSFVSRVMSAKGKVTIKRLCGADGKVVSTKVYEVLEDFVITLAGEMRLIVGKGYYVEL